MLHFKAWLSNLQHLCDSFAQKVLGNREKKRIVLEIFYHAELEGKQPTKCQHWNVNGFHKYLTHTAGTSRCFPLLQAPTSYNSLG